MKSLSKNRIFKVLNPVVFISGVLILLIGLLTLIGWTFRIYILTNWNTGTISMAPSTAILFFLTGLSILLQIQYRKFKSSIKISLVLISLIALTTSILLVLLIFNIRTTLEHLWVTVPKDNEISLGLMSPIAMICFIVPAVSLLLINLPLPFKRIRLIISIIISSSLLLLSYVLLLAYLFGSPLYYGSKFIPPAINTLHAFFLAAFSLILISIRRLYLLKRYSNKMFLYSFNLFIIYILICSAILTASYLYHQISIKNSISQIENQLASISEAKADVLNLYLEERIFDARLLHGNLLFSNFIHDFMKNHYNPADGTVLIDWLKRYVELFHYDRIQLLNTKGNTVYSYPDHHLTPPSSVVLENIPDVVQSGEIRFQHLYISEHDQKSYISIIIPILYHRQTIAVLILRINPDSFLFPFIEKVPQISKSTEVLLVRKDNHDIVFLNQPRLLPHSSLNYKIPLNNLNKDLQSTLEKGAGTVYTEDYRKEKVVGNLKRIQATDWIIMAKTDLREVYAPINYRTAIFITLITLLLILLGIGFYILLRLHRMQTYKAKAESLEAKTAALSLIKESEQNYRTLADSGIALIWTSDTDKKCNYFNKPWLEFTGRTLEQELGDGWTENVHPDDLSKCLQHYSKAFDTQSPFRIEYRLKRHDSEYRWIADYGKPRYNSSGVFLGYIGHCFEIHDQIKSELNLKKALHEKEALLQELYHRTKNTMQIIASLIGLRTAHLNDEKLNSIFFDIKTKIHAIAMIHQKLYESNQLSHIQLGSYIKELTGLIISGYKLPSDKAVFIFELGNVAILIDTAIPLALVITEIISNSIQHAFPDQRQGEIHIKLFKGEEHMIYIEISDNGIGYNDDLNKINLNSFGIPIVRELVKHQLSGNIQFFSENGMKCQIQFPDNLYKQRLVTEPVE